MLHAVSVPIDGQTEEIRGFSGQGLREDMWLVVRFTRHWIHYGWMTFTVLATLIAAVEGVFAR